MIDHIIECGVWTALNERFWKKGINLYGYYSWYEREWRRRTGNDSGGVGVISASIEVGDISFLRRYLPDMLDEEEWEFLESLDDHHRKLLSAVLLSSHIDEVGLSREYVLGKFDVSVSGKGFFDEEVIKVISRGLQMMMIQGGSLLSFGTGIGYEEREGGRKYYLIISLSKRDVSKNDEFYDMFCHVCNKVLRYVREKKGNIRNLLLISLSEKLVDEGGLELKIGSKVTCPRCGEEGVLKVKLIRVKKDGVVVKEYSYLCVYHQGGKWCLLRRLSFDERKAVEAICPSKPVDDLIKDFTFSSPSNPRYFISSDCFSEFRLRGVLHRRWNVISNDFRVLKAKGTPSEKLSGIYEVSSSRGAKLAIRLRDLKQISSCKVLLKWYNKMCERIPYPVFRDDGDSSQWCKDEGFLLLMRLLEKGSFVLRLWTKRDREDGAEYNIRDFYSILKGFMGFREIMNRQGHDVVFHYYFTAISSDGRRFLVKCSPPRFSGIGQDLLWFILYNSESDILIRVWRVPMPKKGSPGKMIYIYGVNFVMVVSPKVFRKMDFLFTFLGRESEVLKSLFFGRDGERDRKIEMLFERLRR